MIIFINMPHEWIRINSGLITFDGVVIKLYKANLTEVEDLAKYIQKIKKILKQKRKQDSFFQWGFYLREYTIKDIKKRVLTIEKEKVEKLEQGSNVYVIGAYLFNEELQETGNCHGKVNWLIYKILNQETFQDMLWYQWYFSPTKNFYRYDLLDNGLVKGTLTKIEDDVFANV